MKDTEQKFLRDITQQLDQSVESLDGATRSRLNRIRHQALEQTSASPRGLRNWLWAGSAALSAVVLALVIYVGLPSQQPGDLQPPQIAGQVDSTAPPIEVAAIHTLPDDLDLDDLEILLDGDDLEMLTDLEFLSWAGSQEEVGG
ncbi:MAG: hypothetical protein ABFS09_08395 [Thermodesulfobacteriota bacterium]